MSLFQANFDLLLYDVTSTYFEGEANANELAQRGHSRDHRPDCKQVCIGLAVSREGYPFGYEVFAGNRTDVTTVQNVVEIMESKYGKANRVWVMDRGMVSEDDLEWLRASKRIEKDLESLGRRLAKARKPADRVQVEWQIGRMLQRNSRAAGKFNIEVCEDSSRASGLRLDWTIQEKWSEWARLTEGTYILRSNVTRWSGEDLWRAYIQLHQAEAAFRIEKSDLRVRPIWHQREERVLAHILVCFLAFAMWKTLEGWQARAGLGNSPRTVIEEMKRIHSVDVVLPLEDGREMRVRCVAKPEKDTAAHLARLGLSLPTRLRPPPLVDKM